MKEKKDVSIIEIIISSVKKLHMLRLYTILQNQQVS